MVFYIRHMTGRMMDKVRLYGVLFQTYDWQNDLQCLRGMTGRMMDGVRLYGVLYQTNDWQNDGWSKIVWCI